MALEASGGTIHDDSKSNQQSSLTSTDDSFVYQEGKVKILGVTGGIGCGKSLACQILTSSEFQKTHQCEIHHIDTDKLAHSVYAPGSEAILQIQNEFGNDVIISNKGDEETEQMTINRKKLGEVVFSDPEALSKLEQIVWPHVKTKILQKIHEISIDTTSSTSTKPIPKVAVVEAAVLLDANWSHFLSSLWILRSPSSITSNRLVSNRNITLDDAMTRIQSQQTRRGIGNLSEEIEKKEVNAVIVNDGSLEDLTQRLNEAWLNVTSWRDGCVPKGNE